MKTILLWTVFCVLYQKGRTQWSAGTEQYYNPIEEQSISMVQVEWYQHNTLYIETRHNYEALNSFSLYMGRSFEKKAAFSYFICPMAAIIWGNYTGAAAGLNAELAYRKLSYNMQAQYAVSIADRADNYFYNWSEFGYQASRKINVGVVLQQVKPFCVKTTTKNGMFLKWQYGQMTFPFYIFDPVSKSRTVTVGINFQREGVKRQRVDIQK